MATILPTQLFGLTVEPDRLYDQVVEESFKVTMASLTDDLPKNASRTSVKATVNGRTFTICSLIPGVCENQPLDLVLNEGDEITFTSTGNCKVDLTGNHFMIHFDDEEDMEGMFSDEEIDSDLEVGSEGEEEMEMDEMDSDEETAFLDADGNPVELMDSDDEDEEELDEEAIAELLKGKKRNIQAIPPADKASKKAKIVEITEAEPKKKTQQEKKKPEPKESPAAKKTQEKKPEQKESPAPAKKTQEKKPETKKEAAPEQKEAQEKPLKKTLPSGLVIEDITVGKGAKAKAGKMVGVRYIGKLTNGKVFDSNTKGKPFSFKLGKGEVIKGWDMGVQGMSIGGTRKLTIPAGLAYGKRGAPPEIPPNATLEFEVKLLEVK